MNTIGNPSGIYFYANHKLFSCKDFEVDSSSEYDILATVALRVGIKPEAIKRIKSVEKLIEFIEPHLICHLVDILFEEGRIDGNSDNYYLKAFTGGLLVQIKS